MANINIYGTLHNATGEHISTADQIKDTSLNMTQSAINKNLSEGKKPNGDPISSTYALPTAGSATKGGVKVDGNGLKMDGENVQVDFAEEITEKPASGYASDKVASPKTVKEIMDVEIGAQIEAIDTILGKVAQARVNLYNAIYGTNYTDESQIQDSHEE